MLSRAVAGIRGTSLVINFPGSPRSVEQTGEAIRDALPHALALLAGETARALSRQAATSGVTSGAMSALP